MIILSSKMQAHSQDFYKGVTKLGSLVLRSGGTTPLGEFSTGSSITCESITLTVKP